MTTYRYFDIRTTSLNKISEKQKDQYSICSLCFFKVFMIFIRPESMSAQNYEQHYLILSHVETVDSTMYQTNETPFVFLSLCLNNYKSATNLNWLPVGSSGTHQWVNFANFPHKTKTRIDFIPIQYKFHNFVNIW